MTARSLSHRLDAAMACFLLRFCSIPSCLFSPQSLFPQHAMLDYCAPGGVGPCPYSIYTPVGQLSKQTPLQELKRDAQQDLMLASISKVKVTEPWLSFRHLLVGAWTSGP